MDQSDAYLFSVCPITANRAEIRPLVKFDREKQKQYAIPVLVSDNESADPRALTGTSLFTVIIGDENENEMKPGSSAIQVFNFEVGAGCGLDLKR